MNWLAAVLICIAGRVAVANPLVGLAPSDDARTAIAIGTSGEVYTPDSSGGWVRTTSFTTANRLDTIGRAGGAILVWGEGVVYKLADNGWSAIRLHQTLKAMMSGGPRAVAAVKRQLFALDRVRAGEPEKLALAPSNIIGIGVGAGIVIATDNGLLRVDGQKLTPLAKAPKFVARLFDDRWVMVASGAFDLTTNKSTWWPTGAVIGPSQTTAGRLMVVATVDDKLELLTIDGGKLSRTPIGVTPIAIPVGLVVDRADRVTIALADGRILTRAGRQTTTWAVTTVREALPAARPGSGPAHAP